MGLSRTQEVVLTEDFKNFDLQTTKSKLQSLNDHLSALLQKKIRIDLEIRRTKNKISKVKNRSKTYIKTSVSLEGFDFDHFTPDHLQLFKELAGEDRVKELYELDDIVHQVEALLETYENLPLYEEDVT